MAKAKKVEELVKNNPQLAEQTGEASIEKQLEKHPDHVVDYSKGVVEETNYYYY